MVCSYSNFLYLQILKEPPNGCLPRTSTAILVRMDSHGSKNLSIDSLVKSPVKDCRKIFLEQMFQSLKETEGGLQDCIQDALLFHSEDDLSTKKVSATPELHVSSISYINCIRTFMLCVL